MDSVASADRETWERGVAEVSAEVARFSPQHLELVAEAVAAIKDCKSELHGIVEGVAAAEICASCGGECCMTGKYHFAVVDLLVYLIDEKTLFTPRFDHGTCPYLGNKGCLMEPAYRPYNCITFNCERVEWLLEPEGKERMIRLEQELRRLYGRLEGLFEPGFRGGLMMNWERPSVR